MFSFTNIWRRFDKMIKDPEENKRDEWVRRLRVANGDDIGDFLDYLFGRVDDVDSDKRGVSD